MTRAPSQRPLTSVASSRGPLLSHRSTDPHLQVSQGHTRPRDVTQGRNGRSLEHGEVRKTLHAWDEGRKPVRKAQLCAFGLGGKSQVGASERLGGCRGRERRGRGHQGDARLPSHSVWRALGDSDTLMEAHAPTRAEK